MEYIQRYVRYIDIILSKIYKNSEDMEFADSSYYRINHMLLLFVTLWPYQRSILMTITRIFFLITVVSLLFVQLTPFLTFEYSTDFFIMVTSYTLPTFICVLQYYFFYVNSDKIKQIWRSICTNWNNLTDETEWNIMQRYSHYGELNTICITLILIIVFGAYASFQFLSLVLDIILPLNESRPHNVYALTEYFVDSETYYYPMLCHWLLGVLFNGATLLATWTFLLVYIHHICGLLKIVCYRIEQSLKGCTIYNSGKKERIFLQRISNAVDIHRTALKYAELLQSTTQSFVPVILMLGAASLCSSWFRIIKAIISHNINDIYSSMIIIIAYFIIMFLSTYYGQQITDHNNEVFKNIYNVQWYIATIKIQKLLLFMMKRTTKEYSLNIGNVITASIEDFAKLFKLSLSYMMVIYSLMKE